MDLINKIITDSADKSEIETHNMLLLNDEAYKKEYESSLKIWNKSKNTFAAFNRDADSAWGNIVKKASGNDSKVIPIHRKFAKQTMRIASAVIVLIACTFAIWNYNNHSAASLSYTSTNEIQEIMLSDGSKIWLNYNSELKVTDNFNENDRQVILKGEAFFDIAKNKEKPFVIECANTLTTVLGTSFNIYSEANNVILDVKTGLVSFKKNNALLSKNELRVTAGESAVYSSKSGKISKTETRLNFRSWFTGRIEFSDTKIEEVCKVLSHDFNKTIECRGKNLQDILISVSFDNETLESILKVISATINAEIIEKEDRIILVVK